MRERTESTAISINNVLATKLDPSSLRFESNMRSLADLVAQVRNEEEKIREGGGAKAIESQHAKARLTARERIDLLPIPARFSNSAFTPPTKCTKNGEALPPPASSPDSLASRPAGHDHRQ